MSKYILSLVIGNTITSGCVYYYILKPLIKRVNILENERIKMLNDITRYKREYIELIELNTELNDVLYKYLNYEIL